MRLMSKRSQITNLAIQNYWNWLSTYLYSIKEMTIEGEQTDVDVWICGNIHDAGFVQS